MKKGKAATSLVAALLVFVGSAPAALVISTVNQTGPVPFTPTWTPATDSLIAGLVPSMALGNFSEEANVRNVNSLTLDGSLTINSISVPNSTCSTNYVTCGNLYGAGSTVIYTLPAFTNGYNLTNITVYGGWQDNGRDQQAYTVYYSTVANPAVFTVLTSVNYNPPVSGGVASATRVVLNDSAGGVIAANVAAVKFDFTSPSSENGYTGYGAITVEGTAATNYVAPPILVTTANQISGSSFTPTWPIETDSLIAGQSPSSVGLGNFSIEAGVTGVGALTDGTFGAVDNPASYATCGSAAGQSVTYFLNGATLTNIVVYSGWANENRDGQFYNLSYSTVANPSTFIPLTSISYNPLVTGVSANRVAMTSSTGAPLATNMAFITFDFTPQTGGWDYGYSGYAEIILEGTNGSPAAGTAAAMNKVFPTSSASSADAVLVFNEIMYHPATNEAGLEWMEFYNQLAVDIDVSGWRVSDDTDYTFPAGTRVAGRSYIVLARDPTTLMAATGLSSNVFGPFVSPLNNQGGTLNLYNNSGRLMDSVTFGTDGDWPVTPDGAGPSLAKIDHDWGSASAANWKASWQVGGTPGAENFVSPPPAVTVGFNEFSGTTNATFWVELMNYGTNPVSLGNCILHHDGATNTDYVFPPTVTINPGAFLVLSNSTLGFIAPASGDKLFLFATNYTAVYDGLVLKKTSRARSPDGTGTWLVPNLPTPGASNSFAGYTEVVINEIMYNHKDFPAATTNGLPVSNPEEWIELYNRSASPVDLTGWTLSGGISYSFSAGKTIAPGGYLVVAKDAGTLHTSYPAIDIVGNYSGGLGNGDDTIILNDPLGNPANHVHYYGGGRWPESPGGGGPSLELRDPNADNSKGEAWAPSKEYVKSVWVTNTYRMVAQASATSAPDDQWHDFVMGLLTDGECWVDDISVIQSPTNNPVQLISNGNFENGLTGWRVVGNHQRSVVETDPDHPGNHVLHIISSGPQEHMNNHIEQTLGQPVVNGTLYEISYRARWISGNNLLNTRLYFNRVARTTALPYPQLNGTPGAVNSVYATNIGPTFAQFQHQPVVPLASQAVTVFVRAQDPQGVSACTVWWSVNGGAWSSAPMTLTNGVYAGTIPHQAASSLVQFYVSAVDGLGAVSTYPAKGPNSGAFYRVNDGLGDLSKAHNLRILMSPANIALQYATTNLMSNENLPCTVIYDERQVYYDMLVRLKSSERGRVDSTRIGFHLEFHPDELFRGVHPVMLVDRSGGGSRPQQEEIVIKHMANHAGVPTVNSDLCRTIAPQSAQNGWAILSPRYEDNFSSTAFTNGSSGILYEMELTYYPLTADANGYKLPAPDNVQGVDITDLGNDKEIYRYNFIIKNHRNTDDYSTLMNFAKSWSVAGSALDTQSKLTTDVDEWLEVYAMVSLAGVADMYTFGGEHNLMAYVRPSDGKVLYLPWDMDFSFSQSATAPLVGNDNLSRIVYLPGNLRRFYAHVQDVINTSYNATYMAPWISHYDSFPGQDWSGDLDYITQRGNYALSEISSAGGNTPFNVSGSNSFTITNNNNLVTLTGTAPVLITSILINGISYPVTWSSISIWTVQVPVVSATNTLNVQGYDLYGNLVTNATQTVVLNGAVPDPAKCIVFNEIMYKPALTNAQYVELYNSSTNFSFDLSGWQVNGLGYTFPAGSLLLPTNYLVLAANTAAFAGAYGATNPVFDTYGGTLSANGETLTLNTASNVTVTKVKYENQLPWPTNANGTGASLQLIDPHQDNWRAGNWTAVLTNTPVTPQWTYVTVTGTASSSLLYLYLQSAGDVYVDDLQLVAGSVPGAGANTLTDGDFESGFPGPWTVSANLTGSVLSTATKHSGSASLHVISTAAGTTQSSAIWQTISPALTANATYTLSFWYLPSTNGGPLTLRLSGSGIIATVNPAPPATTIAPITPAALNSVAASLMPFPTLWLNEVQADNLMGITNRAGQHTGWLELYNPGTNVISLSGLYLANNYTNLLQWAFPTNASIAAGQFEVIFTDAQTYLSTTNELHTSFILPSGSGSLALTRLAGNGQPQVLDYLDYQNIYPNDSYGSLPDGQSFSRQEFFSATPGAANNGTVTPPASFIGYYTPGSVYAQNFDALPNPGAASVNTANTVTINGITYSLANPYDFAYPAIASGSSGGLGISALAGWYGSSALVSRFGATDGDQTTGGQLSFGLPGSANRALGLLATSTTGGTAFGVRFINGTTLSLNRMNLQFTGEVWRQSNKPKTLQFYYYVDLTGTNGFPTVANAFLPGLNVSIPTVAADSGGVAVDGTSPLNQTNLSVLDQTITNWPPGAVLWLVWQMTDSAGTSQGLGIDNLSFSASIPLPVPLSVQVSGTNLFLNWPGVAGQTYQLEYKNNLTDPTWTPVGSPVTGTGATLALTNNATASPQRFFHLRLVN